MTITEFAILALKSSAHISDPTLFSLLQKLSTWQSEHSGFPLLFFIDSVDSHNIYLVTGWASVAAHEAWIRGERNQELLRVFAPYIDMPKIRMIHIDVGFETIPRHVGEMVIERCGGRGIGSDQSSWSFSGRDLARDEGGDEFHLVGVFQSEEPEVRDSLAPAERWVLKRLEV